MNYLLEINKELISYLFRIHKVFTRNLHRININLFRIHKEFSRYFLKINKDNTCKF
jgi:hypothetical protein